MAYTYTTIITGADTVTIYPLTLKSSCKYFFLQENAGGSTTAYKFRGTGQTGTDFVTFPKGWRMEWPLREYQKGAIIGEIQLVDAAANFSLVEMGG